MNCWPSGKYVHLLYMYSILGRGSFCFNYCLTFGVAWRWSVFGTAEVVWKPRFLWPWPSGHLHCWVWCLSSSSWQYLIDSLWGSGQASLLANQAQPNTMVIEPAYWYLAVWAGAKSCWKLNQHLPTKNFLVDGCVDCGLSKHSGPTPADDMAVQIITDCGNFTLDFQATWNLCLSTLPPDSGTLISKWNANLLSSEKRSFGPLSTVQFFFYTAQVRCFWRCLWFRSGLVALFLKMSERGDSWCTDSSFSPLLVKLSQVFESALLDCILKLAVIPVACAPFPTQILPSSQLCI